MEHLMEEAEANEVEKNEGTVSAQPKARECDIPLEPSMGMYIPTINELPESSSSVRSAMLKGPAPPGMSTYYTSSSRLTVQELIPRNYEISEQDVRCYNNRETNHKPQIQWQHFYQLGAGSGSEKGDGDPPSTEKGVALLSYKEKLPRKSFLSPELKLASNKDIIEGSGAASSRSAEGRKNPSDRLLLGNSQSKVLPKSSFTQFFANRSLKGKDVLPKSPAPHTEIHTATTLQNKNEQVSVRMRTSDSSLNPGATSNQASFKFGDQKKPSSTHSGVILREWINSMGSQINKAERIHLFRQIVQLVDIAHSHGIAFQDLRPSFFILLSPNGVRYIGPSVRIDSTCLVNQNTTGKRSLNLEMEAVNSLGAKQQKVSEDMNSMRERPQCVSIHVSRDLAPGDFNVGIKTPQGYGYGETNLGDGSTFLKAGCLSEPDIVQLEKKWYTCPEELNHRSLASSNVYSLGVLFFELLCHFESPAVHYAALLNLQSRILPQNFLCENPKEAGFCFWLLHPQPSSRPTAREILQSELIYGAEEIRKIDGAPSVVEKDEEPDSDLLLYFLGSLQEEKQNYGSKLLQKIVCLEADIKEVEKRDAFRPSNWVDKDINNTQQGSNVRHLKSSNCLSRMTNMPEEKLMKNISQLESAYFGIRSQIQLAEKDTIGRPDLDLLTSRDRLSQVPKKEEELTVKSVDRIGSFFHGICKYARYSKFKDYGTLRNGDLLNSTNVICSLCFNYEEDYIAAAGVSKKIKIFDFNSLLNDSVDLQYPVVEMSNRSKLSCVCWNNYIKNYLASTDYDGMVKIWDASTGQEVTQYIEHQKRAWSVDFCQLDPTKFATGSDDCSVKLWNTNERNSVGTIWNPANICCVQFSAYSSHLLAFGSADYKIYCYDLRHTRIPWCTLSGHQKAVSYVKFLDCETLVSASTDNTLKLWDLKKTSLEGLSPKACSLTFTGHSNEKNFVGLSVSDGYIACGSESNEVCAYYRSLPMPITSYKFETVDPISGKENGESNGQFVSSVCWRRKSNMVIAANSTGCIKLLGLV